MMIAPVVISTSRKENNMAPVVVSTSRKEYNAAPVVITTSRKDIPNFTGKSSGLLGGAKKVLDKQWNKFIEKVVIGKVLQPVCNSKFMAKFVNYVSTSNKSILRAYRSGNIASSSSSLRKGGVQ